MYSPWRMECVCCPSTDFNCIFTGFLWTVFLLICETLNDVLEFFFKAKHRHSLAFKEKGTFQLYIHIHTIWASGEIMDTCVPLCLHLQKESLIMNLVSEPGMIVHTYNTHTWEVSQEKHCEFKASSGYLVSLGSAQSKQQDKFSTNKWEFSPGIQRKL